MNVYQLSLSRYGWAELLLWDENRIAEFSVTNVAPNDAIIDTLIASSEIAAGAPFVAISYFDEPGERRLYVEQKNEKLLLSLRWFPEDGPNPSDSGGDLWRYENKEWFFEGTDPSMEETQIIFRIEVLTDKFLSDVCTSAEKILSMFNKETYQRHWSREYPKDEFERLTENIRLRRSSKTHNLA